MEKREIRRYAGRVWQGLEQELDQVKRNAGRRLSNREMHRATDQVLVLHGAQKAAIEMAELVRAEHRRSVEWALKSAVSAALVLGSSPGIDSSQRDALQRLLNKVLPLIDAQRLDEAERELHAIEEQMDELRMQVIDRRIGDLLDSVQSVQ